MFFTSDRAQGSKGSNEETAYQAPREYLHRLQRHWASAGGCHPEEAHRANLSSALHGVPRQGTNIRERQLEAAIVPSAPPAYASPPP
jgi:hypothetical protein